MTRYLIFLSCIFGIILSFSSCQRQQNEVGFYYWKTNYKQDTLSKLFVSELQARKLYLRIMDIDFDESKTQGIPIAPINFTDSLPTDQEVVPVVFINQRIFLGLDSFAIRALAHKIEPFIRAKLAQGGKGTFSEIQFDCDWTRSSRDPFFYFLDFLKTIPALADVSLSSTLRLHQIKNIQTAGIPPVDRVTLMCYNMGNLRKFGAQNSILNQQDLALYLKDVLKNYPLKIDIALPLFNWFVLFRGNQYIGISKKLTVAMLADESLFSKNPNSSMYLLKKDLPAAGLKKNDVVRYESVQIDDLKATTKFLKKELKTSPENLLFYHLDPEVLGNFTYEELHQISTSL